MQIYMDKYTRFFLIIWISLQDNDNYFKNNICVIKMYENNSIKALVEKWSILF